MSPRILAIAGDYDGSESAKLRYKKNVFDKYGLYFVKAVYTGGEFTYTAKVKKTSSSDSNSWSFDFKIKTGPFGASGGGSKSKASSSYNNNEEMQCRVVGGDPSLNSKLLGYQKMLKEQTVDGTNFQSDYTNWLASIADAPAVMNLEVKATIVRVLHLFYRALTPEFSLQPTLLNLLIFADRRHPRPLCS